MINIWITANDVIPNKPRKPEMKTVNKLIGICNPIDPPNTFRKNKSKIPIPNLTVLCAKNLVIVAGAPINNNKTINRIIIEITITECNEFNSLFYSLSLYMYESE